MALPDESLSSTPMPAPMLFPDSVIPSPVHDYEMGGVALNDASAGINSHPWECFLAGSDVVVRRLSDSGPGTVVMSVPGIDTLSFAFDRNMQPAVAYMVGGVCSLYWYDATIPGYDTITIPGATQPRLSHDDKRNGAASRSDIILAYVRAGDLYYRQQRDRFTIERLLAESVQGELRNVGMNTGLRLQFEMR